MSISQLGCQVVAKGMSRTLTGTVSIVGRNLKMRSDQPFPIPSDGINSGIRRKTASTMMSQTIPKKAVAKYLRPSGLSGKTKPDATRESRRE